MKAVQDEIEREQATQLGGATGAIGGGLLGAAAGSIPVKIGNALNGLRQIKEEPKGLKTLKPGPRMAGGLTGLILGGGLGAGISAMMKQESEAGRLLGKIQAQGGQIDEFDEQRLAQLLGDIYSSPSEMR